MDPARVQWAVETLEANRDPVSARTVLRLLRRTPPYTGGSFTDVLRLLKIQAVPSDAERALAEIEERTAACERALTEPVSYRVRQQVIADHEAAWPRCRLIQLRSGEKVVELAEAFERWRVALTALIGAQAQSRPRAF